MTAYQDTTRPIADRVEALLHQMTLDEKIAQLGSFWIYEVLDGLDFSEAKARLRMSHGIGHVTRLGGASNVRPQQAARLSNTIQRFLLDQTRLKIPAVVHEECCGGYMAFGATVFPQAIGVASAWEPELVEAMTGVIREQMRSVGAHHALAPVLDVARDARWGRVEETFGEDPYLIARTGIAYVKGLQGPDLRAGIVATAKHFVGYGASEGGMNWAPPHIPAREMREVFLLPFEAAVKEARLASVMNGYHELDGVPCGAARWLLTDTLREQWGFTGTLVSDYFAVTMLQSYHALASDKAHAAAIALEAGIDVELPSTDCYGDPLREAVLRGDIREALVDVAVRRVLEQKFALGLFDSPYVDEGIVVFDTPDQRKLARDLAAKSLVLLKNEDRTLPLSKALKSIAVIGPNADVVRNLFGDYSYPAHIETLLEQQAEVTFDTPQPDSASLREIGDFIQVVSVLHAIREKVGPQVALHYARGCGVLDPSTEGFAEAVEAAKQADAVILVLGDKAGLTDSCTSGEARDRAVLDLPGVQPDLMRAVLAAGKPTVLVLVIGRPVTLHDLGDAVDAILVAWFPGEEGAGAIADALFGDVNPGGKLPISFPHTVGQVPVYYGHKPSGGRSHWKGVYVETPCEPRYPFGFGLSYTQFTIGNLRAPGEVQAGSGFQVQVEVSNTGARPGDEVVQLYTRTHGSSLTRPVKELRGFKRVALQPGETRTVAFEVEGGQLGYYNQAMEYVVEPGTLEIMVGASSEDVRERAEVRLTGPVANVEKTFGGRASVS
ncbi:MAG: glycoside hydrolase family 3 C-terminal domain-containing protein [Anaerolineae bacterium]|nr:glycoside hydrolase family 3 C-terminal domain-containing protein [Anaerolineae bacterium]